MPTSCSQTNLDQPGLACKDYVYHKLGLTELTTDQQSIIQKLDQIYLRRSESRPVTVLLCKGTGCQTSGEPSLKKLMEQTLAEKGISHQVAIVETGCRGFCEMGPLVEIIPGNIFYCRVQPEHIVEIVEKTIINHQVIPELLFEQTYEEADKIPFYAKQMRRVLSNSGLINPENINEAVAGGTYRGLKKALFEMTPDEVIEEVRKAGLRGRGGGGFPTAQKWAITRANQGPTRYIICNADEGDPGAFMDRSILEADPHRLIEGMVIAAYAISAHHGFIYVRAEYPLAVSRIVIAIQQARETGILGSSILGSSFEFDLEIVQGAGAFVCGEETAMIASIEGKRGMPSVKPPFPAEKGLFGCPTNVNNVETFANVPLIFQHSAEWYAEVGSGTSRGTKIFALTGKVRHTGLVEVPMGITIREIVYDIGGGIPNDKKFKAVQIGGPGGGCITADYLDLPVDYESLKGIGAIMGSGGLVVLDEDTCMVSFAKYFLNFTQHESCGKCIPCREGTKRMLEILERITTGHGEMQDLDRLETLAGVARLTSACGLGMSAPNPILSTLKYYRDEYIAHIRDKRCPAGACKNFITYHILPTCHGCTLCARVCPVQAISGDRKQIHVINQQTCIKCGECYRKCPWKCIARG
ncbi:MAG: NADH-quinone oxidoreductase subunit NuoF [Candidatus Delongbacteria bacterium]|nr:NADH-quinone oxidoreductase subunit NuoF [Candidatus Delongbacteria bacterium]